MVSSTRVQIVILKDEKYVLLQQLIKDQNRSFWGMPGGGIEDGETAEEAAIREAKEETNLDIKLLPFKYEYPCTNSKIYNKVLIFLAEPTGGVAKAGYDPEPQVQANWAIVDLKWQPLFDDEGIDDITKKEIEPFREYYLEKNR